jgi:protoheme IX farnesyltransferase
VSTAARAVRRVAVGEYLSLLKTRIASLVAVAVLLGAWLAKTSSWPVAAAATFGTLLASLGGGVLNNVLERDIDKKMQRTRARALPRAAISVGGAAVFGLSLVAAGVAVLLLIGWLAAALAAAATVLYVAVYTPLKRVTWWNTLVGAVPGAIPPLIGWSAATGDLAPQAWLGFLLLFLWQLPHFYAIAWRCRDDYASADLRMATSSGHRPALVVVQVLAAAVLLLPTNVAIEVAGMAGAVYLTFATLATVAFALAAIAFARQRNDKTATTLLRASVYYLPAILIALAVDRVVAGLL